jgi:hypothetical protein
VDFLAQLESNFDTKPVGIAEFAESKEFCGKPLYPRQRLLLKLLFLEDLTPYEEKILDYWIAGGRNGDEIVISPDIRERIKRLKARGYKHFREVVLVAGRRASKGHTTGLAMAKTLYDVLRIDDPRTHFALAEEGTKEIYWSCIATAQDQAKKLQYADLTSSINSCRAMSKYIQKTQELEASINTQADLRRLDMWKRQGRKVMKDTAMLRCNALPANQSSIRGQATLVADFDEFAHFQQGESAQSDTECYAALKPSLDQFGNEAMLFVKSSPASKVGKFYERFQMGMAVDEEGVPLYDNIFVIQIPSWALYEGWWDEDAEFFGPQQCQQASPDWDPDRIREDGTYYYNEKDRELIFQARQEEQENPEKFKVENRGKWAETIDAYLMPEKVDAMYAGRPLLNESGIVIGYTPMETNYTIAPYTNVYVGHLDPASTTAGFGFALGHLEYFAGTPHVIFDIVKNWEANEFGGVIDVDTVLEEVTRYVGIFRPKEITTDQFQSAAVTQGLRKRIQKHGWTECRVYEKTATALVNWNRCETFKTALYRGLVHSPADNKKAKYSAQELKFLQKIQTGQIPRVEHQTTGEVQTKDIADCIMTVTETLIGDLLAQDTRAVLSEQLRAGGEGGYPMLIGGGGTTIPGRLTLNMAHNEMIRRAGGNEAQGPRGPANRRNSSIRGWGAKPGYGRRGR